MATPDAAPAAPPARLRSLDAYRGAVMILLAVNGFGLATLAKDSDSAFLKWLGFQTSHPEWVSHFHFFGFALWDMIQPAFMFIVGVAVPYSYAKRAALGESRGRIMAHAWTRSLLLILLGVFLSSTRAKETQWIFTNVLSQIGLGYPFLALLAGRALRTQLIAGAAVLAATWLLFAFYPVATAPSEAAAGGAGPLTGFFAHWSIHTNVAAVFDQWFLNLFPRSEVYEGNPGGYTTLNFVPAFVTMLIGLICGELLRNPEVAPAAKVKRLLLGAAVMLGVGVLLGMTVCPIVKRIWTPSWVLFSGAYVVALLALFYGLIDVKGWKPGVWILVVAGLNPLALYLMGQLSKGWTLAQLKIHLPDFVFTGSAGPVAESLLPAAIFWLVVWWMHRNRVYLRL
jgi:heparan-alpha-glucosaminide N-acetyltransferase